jgi:hypothetical protein
MLHTPVKLAEFKSQLFPHISCVALDKLHNLSDLKEIIITDLFHSAPVIG